jgi:outer membrane protein assembly factor BamE (lipoprotein component of BamABCDE complex)|tara:strand:- start:154 stop:615 length:462 start_codon:yes stop_codon:yes gene_type:complete
MNKIFLIIVFLLISNCTLNKVVKHHGVHFLDKKQAKLILLNTNKNDIVELLGPPSTKGTFNNDLWIYIERKKIESSLIKFSKDKMLTNNVLLLEIDNNGILVKKDFFDITKMNELDFNKKSTKITYDKKGFIYDFLASMRQKIDSPAKKKQSN